jgi:hypothetical protein
LKLIIRLSKEAKAFHNTNSYGYASELLANICRQAEAWYSYSFVGGKQNEPRMSTA